MSVGTDGLSAASNGLCKGADDLCRGLDGLCVARIDLSGRKPQMKNSEGNYYNAFVRVPDFGAENTADFPSGSVGVTILRRLRQRLMA